MKVLYAFLIFLVAISFFVWHWFIYISLIKFLVISSITFKKVLIINLLFLSLSYLFAEILSRISIGIGSRIFYYVASTWLGLSLYLFFACLFAWFIFWLFHWQSKPLFIFLLVFVLVTTIYGLFNAWNIKYKYLDIKIKNLPISWQNQKIIQISDIHLGPWYREGFITKIVGLINKEKPAAVFITGDYFDYIKHSNDSELVEPLKNLQTEKGIYAIIGNHDFFYGEDDAEKLLASANVTVLRDEIKEIDGLEIIGAEYRGPEAHNEKSYLPLLHKRQKSLPSIMLAHEPVLIQEVSDAGVDLLLCGHTHKGQIWPVTYMPMYFFKKFYYGLQQLGNLHVYTTSGLGTWGPIMRIASQPEIVVINLQKDI